MRVLFVTYAAKAHFHAMVPVAWALRAAGHEVRVASQPELLGTITDAGLTAVSVGRDHQLWRSLNRFLTERFAAVRPDVHAVVRSAGLLPFDLGEGAPDENAWEQLRTAYDTIVRSWYKIANNTMLPDLVDFTKFWQPDLVIWEPNTYVGAIAAKVSGAAHARLLWGMDIFGFTRERYLELMELQPPDDRGDALAAWIDTLAMPYDCRFSEDMAVGHFTIDQLPDALRMAADLHYVRMRYVPYNGPAVVPSWLWDEPERPRVALTLGVTSADHFGGYGLDVQETLDELAGLDIEVVATVPEKEQVNLRSVPPNARVLPFVPLHALLPSCSLAIHHTGFGSLCSTLTYGVPLLCLPERFDEPALARRIVDHGAGLAMPMAEATGSRVREMVTTLLEDPSFGRGAERLRTEMHVLPSPNEMVQNLEELAGAYRET